MTHTSQLKLLRQEVSDKEAALKAALLEAQEAQAAVQGRGQSEAALQPEQRSPTGLWAACFAL